MEVSNASPYDGGTALAEAALIPALQRSRLIVDGAVNPLSPDSPDYLALGELIETAPTAIVSTGLLCLNF
jgi:glycine dehydrogenase subunit 1